MVSLRQLLAADLLANAGPKADGAWLRAFLTVPGFRAIAVHRIAVMLARWSGLLSDLLWRRNVRSSGCHLHRDAQIGGGLALPHPVGIVIGAGSRIGDGVTIYQSVTIGQLPGRTGYPTVGDGVTIYPGAVVAGPVTIGTNAVIGALSYIDRDIPAGAVASGSPLRVRTQVSPAAPR